ncbi:hypothetical protein P43SY_000927 [Pythium insidiosum]|uniref:Uncharacterized protein n=1 Tax=Pythium insidiosum TaxID=114742 RepID=A0AAD5LGV6_PYTIN|nr:hypothetical protein P43SY_000927 [Pythium insidiosum]
MTSHYNRLYDMGTATQNQVKNSTEEITTQIRISTGQLASIHKASCVQSSTADSSFRLARQRYNTTLGNLASDLGPTLESLKKLGKTVHRLVQQAWIEQMLYMTGLAIGSVGDFFKRPGNLAQRAKGVKVGHSDALDIIQSVAERTDEFIRVAAEIKKLDVGDDEMKAVRDSLDKHAAKLIKLYDEIPAVEATDPVRMIQFAKVITGIATDQEMDEFVQKEYANMVLKFRYSEVSELMRGVSEVLSTTCYNLQHLKEAESAFTSKQGAEAIDQCHDLTNSVGGIADRFRDAVTHMDQMREFLAVMASSGMECSTAKNITNNVQKPMDKTRLRHRALQQQSVDVPSNQPYYTMAFAALSKLILDYRLQEAAFQFCKFYEYKNGGVAPKMCDAGSKTTYFTLGQVLEMRAWSPPAYNTVKIRGLLPTKPVYSKAHRRFYPFVDLKRLRDGSTVDFALPLWDVDWLRAHGWISATAAADRLPSVYIDSVLVYLPLQINPALGNPATSSLSTTVQVKTTDTQYLSSATAKRKYVLPPQTFTTDVTYGATWCLDENRIANPYDVAARCVQSDAASDVCLRVPGTSQVQNQKRLLPSLFSTWQLSAAFAGTPSGALDLLIPRANIDWSLLNGTAPDAETVGDLHLIVDAVVVQVSDSRQESAGLEAVEDAGGATCCAPDEFRASKSKCQKCSRGTVGAARGFACVPIRA